MERACSPCPHGRPTGKLRNRQDRSRRPPRPVRGPPDRAAALTSDKKALIFCGPTASGKSALADTIAERLSEVHEEIVPTILIDSMQVYKEIPVITNQARERPAELTGIVSVTEEWTVARHKERAERIINSLTPDLPFVLDAGTGMYLNALTLSVPLAPKVPGELRAEAASLATGAQNPRRKARELELDLAGAPVRGSIWDGCLRYDATFVYLRPPREVLDNRIRGRSKKIIHGGAQEEAQTLLDSGLEPNPSVREAIGVREMLLHATGSLSVEEAEDAIAARTRRLARRQIRWFDKLAKSLPDSVPLLVVEAPDDEKLKHFMHGKIVA